MFSFLSRIDRTRKKLEKPLGYFGHDLGKRAEFPTAEGLVGCCIAWRASVGWKAVFAGLRIVILRSVVFLPEHLERRLISEAGQGIAVYRIVSISRNRAGTVPGHS